MRRKRVYHWYRNKRTGETYGTGSKDSVTYARARRYKGDVGGEDWQ